jgi:hypothetical protein
MEMMIMMMRRIGLLLRQRACVVVAAVLEKGRNDEVRVGTWEIRSLDFDGIQYIQI